MVAGDGNDQDRRTLHAGQRPRHSLTPDGGANRPRARTDGGGGEPPGRRHRDRNRSGRARRAGRPHGAAGGEFLRHQSALAARELRSNDELRTGLLSRVDAHGPGRAGFIALPDADDLIAAARAKPGELAFASGGPGSSRHIAIEVLKRAANISITYVPYGGTAPAINALMGNHVAAVWADYPTVVSQLQSGTLRGLVTTSKARIETLPDVPTLGETGISKYEAEIFYGIVAPAKTPSDALNRLSGWFSGALKAPDMKPKLAQQGLFPVGMCGAEFGAYLRRQVDEYSRVIREANITVK